MSPETRFRRFLRNIGVNDTRYSVTIAANSDESSSRRRRRNLARESVDCLNAEGAREGGGEKRRRRELSRAT